jgi:hypothetical protein
MNAGLLSTLAPSGLAESLSANLPLGVKEAQRSLAGNAMFSRARLDTISDGIFGVSMTLLILDAVALNFAAPLIGKWSRRAVALD